MAKTAKEYKTYFEENGWTVYKDDQKYFVTDWITINKIEKLKTAVIFFSGNILADDMNVYHTFSVHPNGENFDPYPIAIERD